MQLPGQSGARCTIATVSASGAVGSNHPSSIDVTIPSTAPLIVERFGYHCHAVDHEDKGMMGIIEVVG